MSHRLSRRTCLRGLAATATAGIASRAVGAEPAPGPGPKPVGPKPVAGWIDAHVHVWTSDTDKYPLAPKFKREDMKPASFTPEALFRHMRPAGVDRVNLIQMSYYGFDNAYMLNCIDRYPGTFVGTAIVDPFGPDPAGEMARLAERHCRAFRIHPGITKQPPQSWLRPEPMAKMFAAAAQRRLALSVLIDPRALAELDRMCGKHPGAPVIIDHLCRIGASGSIDGRDIDALAALARHENVYVKIGAFYALGRKQPPYLDLLGMIRRVVEAFTPQRCMWETDCPFQVVRHTYEDSLALVRDHADFLSAADKKAILRETAERLLLRR